MFLSILAVVGLAVGPFYSLMIREASASSTPQVLVGATQVSAGRWSSCATVSGVAYCWGDGEKGQLGNGQTGSGVWSWEPVAVAGVLTGKTVTQVVTSNEYACAIADGAVYCWGQNNTGQLGNGTYVDSATPVAVDATGVLAGKTVTQIALSTYHTCAVADGAVYCWGDGSYNALGNGVSGTSNIPVAVDMSGVLAGKTITQVSIGSAFSCALADGAVYCWGANTAGQLGNGTIITGANDPPVAVDTSGVLAGKTVTYISAAHSYVCAIADGAVYCWGYNFYGQLGNGTSGVSTESTVPVAVDTSGVLAGKTVTRVSAGNSQTSCAIADDAVYCWGANSGGQFGNGNQTNSAVPVASQVAGGHISLGDTHVCALIGDRVSCWGGNNRGQLGDATIANKTTPVEVIVGMIPVPEIDSILPDARALVDVSGQLVTIYGQDFDATATVTIGGRSAHVTTRETTHLVVSVPESSTPGFVDVAVTNGNGHTTMRINGFEYYELRPQIDSLSDNNVLTNVADTELCMYGSNFGGVSVAIGGRTAEVISENANEVCVLVPQSSTPGTVDISVTNSNGLSTVLSGEFRYISRNISSVTFGEEAGKKIMTVNGTGLVGATHPDEYFDVLEPPFGSFVTLNGTTLDFCTDGTGFTEAVLSGYGFTNVSDAPSCYYLFDSNIAPVITPTSAKIWLADDFDVTAPGSVSVNDSPLFLFNQPPVPSGGGTVEPTVLVNGRALFGTPEITSSPVFSGVAQADARVTVTVHSNPVSCTAVATAQNTWQCSLPENLEPGTHTVYVRVVNPDNSVVELGPYKVTVAGDGATMQAPNTGMGRIWVWLSPQVLLLLGSVVFLCSVVMYVAVRKMRRVLQ